MHLVNPGKDFLPLKGGDGGGSHRTPSGFQSPRVKRLEKCGGVGKAVVVGTVASQHGPYLNIEIGIMLGRRPDRENQMPGIEFGDLAVVHPALENGGLLVDQGFQLALEHGQGARRAVQHLVGEQAAFARQVARHLDLAANIGGDFGEGIAVFVHLRQRRQPGLEQAEDEGFVDLVLVPEIIEQVGLGHAGGGGDLVDRGAAKPVVGKYVERGIEDAFPLFRLNARSGSGLRNRHSAP